jgi:hypothetical protein
MFFVVAKNDNMRGFAKELRGTFCGRVFENLEA